MVDKIRCFGFRFKEVSTIRGNTNLRLQVDVSDTDEYEADAFVFVHERAREEFAKRFFPEAPIPDNVYLYPDPTEIHLLMPSDAAYRYSHRVSSGVWNLPLCG
ncbi:MAG: hypothetical protein Q8P13_01900 [bacterium]|nr:hypothetical protein [bacterium]